jgi:hypothetical protein
MLPPMNAEYPTSAPTADAGRSPGLRGVGRARAGVWVVELNEGARSFYQAVGFAFDGATQLDEDTEEHLVALRYRTRIADGEV